MLTNLFGKSYMMIIFIFSLFGWPGLARVIRSQVLVLKNSNYVKAAELCGATRRHVMFRHILPGVSHLLIMSTICWCWASSMACMSLSCELILIYSCFSS